MLIEKLTDIISQNEFFENLEDVICDETLLIDEGYYLEIYINPKGIKSNIMDTAIYYWRYIDKACMYGDLLSIFNKGSIKNNTLTFRIIPSEDIFFKKERSKSTAISLDFYKKNKKIA